MPRTEQKLFIRTFLLGVLLTLLVMVSKGAGLLQVLDHWLYNRRAQYFQHFTPPPTSQIVHLDMDDAALEAIGRWPWPRARWAELLDELSHARAKVIGLDVFFSEEEAPIWEPIKALPRSGGSPDVFDGRFRRWENDKLFADSVRRAGNVVLGTPVAFEQFGPIAREERSITNALVTFLQQHLAGDAETALEHLRTLGFGKRAEEIVASKFISARRRAMHQRIVQEISEGAADKDQIRKRLLGDAESFVTDSPMQRLFNEEYERIIAGNLMSRFSRSAGEDRLPPLATAVEHLATIPLLAEAAAAAGFVDDPLRFEQDAVRSVPLWVRVQGKMRPQLGLAMVCKFWDVPLEKVGITEDAIVIRAPDGERRIPVRTYQSRLHGEIGTVMDIPWFGGGKWETMYDHRQHQASRQHWPINVVWSICQTTHVIQRNNASADKAIRVLLGSSAEGEYGAGLDPAKAQAYMRQIPALDDINARNEIIEWTLGEAKPFYDDAKKQDLSKLLPEERFEHEELIGSYEVLRTLKDRNSFAAGLRERLRRDLREKVENRAVLIGWTAEGKVDYITTPWLTACPGVVVHGTIFNGIVTGETWRRMPQWVSYGITLMIGVLVAWIATALPPWQTLGATLLAMVLPATIDSFLVFDYGNRIVDMAGPIVVAPVVWSMITVVRFFVERLERSRITKRFRSYVDPALVQFVIEHPETAKLSGEERELTVVFTDLGNFTTLTEELRGGTVPILNEYMSLMVPIIRKHRGFVNKFLGDGIMFFFGAPFPDPEHAFHAADAVMEMNNAMIPFNAALRGRKLPELVMRAGVSTGQMVVGDAGPAEGSDYTVLGDAVNLASRLESANKVTGTNIMLNDRCASIVGERYLLLPLARLQVKGKREGIMTYTPLATLSAATPAQKRHVQLMHRLLDRFHRGEWTQCLSVISEIEHTYGASTLLQKYADMCHAYLEAPPAHFDGTIVLAEK